MEAGSINLLPFFFMIIFRLTSEERKAAIDEGRRRQYCNETKLFRGRNGGEEIGPLAERHHLIGAAGEMAVASYLGLKEHLYKEENPRRDSYDLPFCIDVKTRSQHWHELIVQRDDINDKIYWLVTIQNKEIRIQGWLPHSDCAKKEFYQDPAIGRPAFFVPKEELITPQSFSLKMGHLTEAV